MFTRIGIGQLLGPIFDEEVKKGPGHFPNAGTRGRTLVMISDFGGQHRGQAYETYAFLIFDLENNMRWLSGQRLLRFRTLGRRRMSFKNMNDSERRRALIPFLRLASDIDGWLILFAVPRQVNSLFQESVDASSTDRALLSRWKPRVQEKLLRILHFSSFILSGLSAPKQDVLWVIDEDDVAANVEQFTRLTELLGQISSTCLMHDMGHLRCGTTRLDDGTIALEDLAAIPDLAAGAFSEIGTQMVAQGSHLARGIATPLPKNLSWKSRVLATWLASNHGQLRRLTYLIRADNLSPGIGVTALKWHALSRPSLILPYRAPHGSPT